MILYCILLLIPFSICSNAPDWSKKQECWTKKGGVCVMNDENFSCPFSQSVTWWKGCPSGYTCCVPRRQPQRHIPITSQQCGYRSLNGSTGDRVIGGFEVKKGEFPWQALIRHYGSAHCGGVVISDRWIMTAAHCLYLYNNRELYSVETGMVMLDGGGSSQKPQIEEIIVHESFDTPLYGNDIALIRLKTPLIFDNFTSPICLPRKNNTFIDHICTVSGWGWNGKENAQRLTGLNLPTMTYERCKKTSKSGQYIYRNNLCAGYKAGQRDACQGDSGGPFACRMNSGQWLLGGVVSSGGDCGLAGEPAVFTRVTSFLDWITKKTGLTWN